MNGAMSGLANAMTIALSVGRGIARQSTAKTWMMERMMEKMMSAQILKLDSFRKTPRKLVPHECAILRMEATVAVKDCTGGTDCAEAMLQYAQYLRDHL